MKIEQLGLAIGDAMQLQIGDKAELRYPVTFYGMNPNGSIIVSAPRSGQDKMIFVREGQMVTLRFMSRNVVSGFSARVLITRGQPYPYIHLQIPQDIQTVEVRKEVRVETNVSLTVMNKVHNSPAMTGRMLNMSCSGGRFETGRKLALEGNKLDLTMKLEIDNLQRLLTFDAIVSYAKEDEETGLFSYGVNIDSIDDEDMVTLRAYIYQQLLKSMHMI